MFDNQMCVKIGDFGEAKPYQSFLEKMVALQEQVEDDQGGDFVNIGNAYEKLDETGLSTVSDLIREIKDDAYD